MKMFTRNGNLEFFRVRAKDDYSVKDEADDKK